MYIHHVHTVADHINLLLHVQYTVYCEFTQSAG